MTTDHEGPGGCVPAQKHNQNNANLSPAARRALEEAENRRKIKASKKPKKELGGRNGPEPTRFGDWENKGIASDF